MSWFRPAPLVLLALVSVACGPARGLRDAPNADPTHRLDASAAGSDMYLLRAVPLASSPTSLAAEGRAIWAATAGSPAVERIDAATGRTGPELFPGDLPATTPGSVSVLATPRRLWILHPVSRGSLELSILFDRQTTPYPALPHATSWSLLRQSITFFRGTQFIGATRSAVWLLGPAVGTGRYVLFRHDLRSARTVAFPLTSVHRPVAAIVHGVLIDLREPRAGSIVLERRRDPAHPLVTPLAHVPGTLQVSSFASCGGDLIGWSADSGGRARVVVVDAASAQVRSAPIRPFPPRGIVRAMATDPSCRRLWVSAAGPGTGAVMRFRLSSLDAIGVLRSTDIGSLVWADGGLWAADDVHDAVIRIQ